MLMLLQCTPELSLKRLIQICNLLEISTGCILDDVISTGESLHALEELVKAAGANVVKRAAVLAEGDSAKRTDIVFLRELPLFPTAE